MGRRGSRWFAGFAQSERLIVIGLCPCPFLAPAPLDGFLRYQPHGPTGAALGRIGADHGDSSLSLVLLQQASRSRPLLIVECGFQASRAVAMAHLPNCLRGQGKGAGDSRRAEARSLTAEAPGHARRFGPAGRRRAIASATQLCRPASLRSAGLDATCLKYAPKHVIMLLFYKNLFRQSKN